MRKKDSALHDALLSAARDLADTEGIDAVNIRAIAGKAGVAAGTVYNYFSNKDEILLALTEEYWQQTLLALKTVVTADSFCRQLQEIFAFLQIQIDQSAGKLMSSLGSVEAVGQARMVSMQLALEKSFIQCLDRDPEVRQDIWEAAFTKEEFAHFIMINMMMLLKMRATDPAFLIEMVRRVLY